MEYILNKESSRIELHGFTRDKYQQLSVDQKSELKRAYLFSGKFKMWVSRSTRNHYNAVRVAKQFGFEDGGSTGERLSYSEQLERKSEKATNRAERLEQYAENAEGRAEALQSEFNEMRKDWSWLTQPNINSSTGRAFTNQRNKIMNRFEKGIDEYRKSTYFRERAATAHATANQAHLKSKPYLNNRIEECNANIRRYERRMVSAEEAQDESWANRLLELIEIEMDKLAFFLNCLDELGGIEFNKDNVKVGYHVKIRDSWGVVQMAGPKNVKIGYIVYPYAEIQEVRIPDDWKEQGRNFENPLNINDIFTWGSIGGDRIIKAFQVVKKTAKTVTLQQISVKDNVPIKDDFLSDKQMRKKVPQNGVLDYDGYAIYKYQEAIHS